jgi:hypothetical protein
MPLPAPTAPNRTQRNKAPNPLSAGLPDPRAVTDYTVEYGEDGGRSLITVLLGTPCIIREPMWSVIDVSDGSSIGPVLGKPQSPTQILFVFEDGLPASACLLDVPYQDVQVQNFAGGFVRPGAKWFRAPG